MKKLTSFTIFLLLLCVSLTSIAKADTLSKLTLQDFEKSDIPVISYTVKNKVDMLSRSFVEGFTSRDGVLYVSSGGFGYSYLTAYTLDQNKSVYTHFLDQQAFAEGISYFNHKLYQLNYQSKTVNVYEYNLKPIGEIQFPIAGWGMTHNQQDFIISDGSNRLYIINHDTLKITRTLKIFIPRTTQPINHLNDLTYVNGNIYANIFGTTLVIKINGSTGEVNGILDLDQLSKEQGNLQPNCTMNGITYVQDKNMIAVGGKCWKQRYLIKLNQ